MTERAQIRLVVNPERRDKWDEYVADSTEYNSRSDLIRRAVEHEISGRHTSDSGGQTGEIETQMGEIKDTMKGLVDRFEDVENRLADLEIASGQEPKIDDLTEDLFGLLPTESELDEFTVEGIGEEMDPKGTKRRRELLEGDGELKDHQQWLANSGRPDVFARLLGEDEVKVIKGLEKLENNTSYVRTKQDGGRTVYYREQ